MTALDAYTTGSVARLGGPNRYATASSIHRTFWTVTPAYVATGTGFADALAAGAVAGAQGRPVILVAGTWVPLESGQEVLRIAPHRLTVVGGPGAVAGSAVTRLAAAGGDSVAICRSTGDRERRGDAAGSRRHRPMEDPMRYVILTYVHPEDAAAWEAWTPEEQQADVERHLEWFRSTGASTSWAARSCDLPQTVKTLRPGRQGEGVSVTDGPFVETKEIPRRLRGLEVETLDQAVEMARGVAVARQRSRTRWSRSSPCTCATDPRQAGAKCMGPAWNCHRRPDRARGRAQPRTDPTAPAHGSRSKAPPLEPHPDRAAPSRGIAPRIGPMPETAAAPAPAPLAPGDPRPPEPASARGGRPPLRPAAHPRRRRQREDARARASGRVPHRSGRTSRGRSWPSRSRTRRRRDARAHRRAHRRGGGTRGDDRHVPRHLRADPAAGRDRHRPDAQLHDLRPRRPGRAREVRAAAPGPRREALQPRPACSPGSASARTSWPMSPRPRGRRRTTTTRPRPACTRRTSASWARTTRSTSTTCSCGRSSCSSSTRTCWPATRGAGSRSSWTSTRTRTAPSTSVPAPGGEAQEPRRGRRRRPVDLLLARRRPAQHPRLRGRLSRRTVVKLEQNYRSHPDDPGRGARGRQPQCRAQGQAPLDRSRRRDADHAVRRLQRVRGGRVRRAPGREAGRGRGAAASMAALLTSRADDEDGIAPVRRRRGRRTASTPRAA